MESRLTTCAQQIAASASLNISSATEPPLRLFAPTFLHNKTSLTPNQPTHHSTCRKAKTRATSSKTTPLSNTSVISTSRSSVQRLVTSAWLGSTSPLSNPTGPTSPLSRACSLPTTLSGTTRSQGTTVARHRRKTVTGTRSPTTSVLSASSSGRAHWWRPLVASRRATARQSTCTQSKHQRRSVWVCSCGPAW